MFSSFLSTDKNRGETSIIHAWNTKSRGKAFLPRFATSLSLSPFLSRPFPPSASSRVSVRLKGWLTDWRDELLQGILERIVGSFLWRVACTARSMEFLLWASPSFESSLLRQVCFGNYAASSFIRVRRPSPNHPAPSTVIERYRESKPRQIYRFQCRVFVPTRKFGP